MVGKDDVIKYLSYLRELSRKIGVRVDFSNLFIRPRRKRINPEVLKETLFFLKEDLKFGDALEITRESDGDLYNFLKKKLREMANSDDKALFLGVGLLKYFIKTDTINEIRVFAPIFVVNLEVREEERKITLDIGNSFLNYDLFDKLPLGQDEEYGVRDDLLDFVKEVEEKMETCADLESLRGLAEEVVEQINYMLESEEKIKILQERLSFEILANQQNYYYDGTYLFLSNFPTELSTYKSLELLIEEIKERGDLKNKVLQKLLSSALSERVNLEKLGNFSLGDLRYEIPIPISKNQERALENAINHEVSYIQGPPGTGKSHTITALALLFILLDKKILIVSQKAPAIKVLFEKLSRILSSDENFLPFIYFYKEYKRKTKENIENIIKQLDNIKIYSIKQDLKNTEDELKQKIRDYKKITEEYKKYLKLTEEYTEKTQSFERSLTNFEYEYEIQRDFIQKLYQTYKGEIQRFMDFLKSEQSTFKTLEEKGKTEIGIYILRRKRFLKKLGMKSFTKGKRLSYFAKSLYELLDRYREIQYTADKLKGLLHDYSKTLSGLEKEIKELARKRIATLILDRIYSRAWQYKEDLSNLKSIFHYTKDRLLKEAQERVNYENVLKIFNIWITDIPSVDRILPMKPNLFDLVVVDESSQVNLAQIIPVFYRGKSICVVGDHKQLNLEAVGLGFRISNKLDTLVWERYKPAGMDYEKAKKRRLVLTKASILEFLSPDKHSEESDSLSYINEDAIVMLDEHFRSVYPLASFTSREFYDGKLHVMTRDPNREGIAFKVIKVEGKRSTRQKIVEAEAEEVLKIIKSLKDHRAYQDVKLPEYVPQNFEIGVLSFVRDQVEYIRLRLMEEDYDNILVGTPEEFQGHEKDIMIISLALDESCSQSRNHYEQKNRFNVATSRAKYFTFLVYAGLPQNFNLTKRYILHFENYYTERLSDGSLDVSKFESKLEEAVYYYLREIVEELEKKYKTEIKIFNQYETCGYRLDFVIYCKQLKKFLAIEVDGPHHFKMLGNKILDYADWHVERVERLKRAGWQIIHTPYYKWYINGWLDKENPILKGEIENLKKALEEFLFIEKAQA